MSSSLEDEGFAMYYNKVLMMPHRNVIRRLLKPTDVNVAATEVEESLCLVLCQAILFFKHRKRLRRRSRTIFVYPATILVHLAIAVVNLSDRGSKVERNAIMAILKLLCC